MLFRSEAEAARGGEIERAGVARDFADHDPKTMPILSEWLETYLAPGVNGVVDGGIVFLIQSIAALRGEVDKWARVIKDAGIQVQQQ